MKRSLYARDSPGSLCVRAGLRAGGEASMACARREVAHGLALRARHAKPASKPARAVPTGATLLATFKGTTRLRRSAAACLVVMQGPVI
jgi:hypothetical protein